MARTQEEIRTTIPVTSAWQLEDFKKKAEALGYTKNSDLVLLGAELVMGFDVDFINTMHVYAAAFRVPLATVIENFIIDKLAQEKAEDAVFGSQRRLRKEFITISDEQGSRMATGAELESILFEHYEREEQKKLDEVKARREAFNSPSMG